MEAVSCEVLSFATQRLFANSLWIKKTLNVWSACPTCSTIIYTLRSTRVHLWCDLSLCLPFKAYVNGVTFKKDAAENVIVQNPAALNVVKVLFEVKICKISENFVKHIYTNRFSKIFILQLKELIMRQFLRPASMKNCQNWPNKDLHLMATW